MNTGIYTEEELQCLGHCGKNVQIDNSVKFINPQNIFIGDNVRIDAFSILSGANGIEIGDFIHLAPYCQLVAAGGKITLANFSALAARTSIFTASDDFTDGFLTNPTVPIEFRKVKSGPVTLHKYSIVGCGTVILPNRTLYEGAAVGALSLVTKDVEAFTLVGGSPAKQIGVRNKEQLHSVEKQLYEKLSILQSAT